MAWYWILVIGIVAFMGGTKLGTWATDRDHKDKTGLSIKECVKQYTIKYTGDK